MPSNRVANLRAALAAVLVQAHTPELALMHRWLDSWAGIGRVAVEAFEEAGESWIDENVFIYEAPSPGAGHRLARRLVRMLRSSASREAET